jgi:hypothetical protein
MFLGASLINEKHIWSPSAAAREHTVELTEPERAQGTLIRNQLALRGCSHFHTVHLLYTVLLGQGHDKRSITMLILPDYHLAVRESH